MELLQLKYFVKVAELQNMSKAATQLNVVQSAVSRSIKRLEEDLGVTVFDRKGRSIILNEAGKEAYIKAKEILALAQQLYDMGDKYKGKDVIHIVIEAASFIMPDLLLKYRQLHSETEFIIQQHDDNKACDLLITSICEKPEMDQNVLIKEEVKLLIPHGLIPPPSKGTIALSSLKELPFVGLKKSFPLRQAIDSYTHAMGFHPSYVLEADSPDMLRKIIASGMGVTFFPEKTWGTYKDGFSMLSIEEEPFIRYIVSIQKSSSKEVALLQRFLKEHTKAI